MLKCSNAATARRRRQFHGVHPLVTLGRARHCGCAPRPPRGPEAERGGRRERAGRACAALDPIETNSAMFVVQLAARSGIGTAYENV
ncbi:hypothetical protein Cch02nite_83320 [Catellatospora chokoriensis]|uniref:Uncharacterized protein n=1 Tax=Catellatospora chokoriensis TaxID=310353 RepID=A0A8J3NWG9_9ACTN|nr:hypothetical protein Cch02nite_83320 [Catellatospora chokoriensis]